MGKLTVAEGSNADMQESSQATLLPQGMYFGRVEDVKRETYTLGDGKRMVKDVYTWTLYTEEGEHEMITDLTIGNVNENGQLYRPDGKKDKSAIWGGSRKKHDNETGKDVYVITTITSPILALGVPTFAEYDNELMKGRVAYIELVHEPFTMRRESGENTNHYKNAIGRIYPVNRQDAEAQGMDFVYQEGTGICFANAQALEDHMNMAALQDNSDIL